MYVYLYVLQRRRERINERLRILQNLIPNGTKVDISTMLEEAVHYVKFLQLQIKVGALFTWKSFSLETITVYVLTLKRQKYPLTNFTNCS